MLSETEIYELLLRKKDATIDAESLRRLEEWAAESESNAEFYALFDDGELTEDLRRMLSYDQDRVWGAICRAEAAHRRPNRLFQGWFRVAAAAAVLIAAVTTFVVWERSVNQKIITVVQPGRTMAVLQLSTGQTVELTDVAREPIREADATEIVIDSASTKFRAPEQKNKTDIVFNTISVPRGCEYQIELCDGTKVWLNAQSELKFPTRFEGPNRTVELRGEAYFEVRSNPSCPFIVQTPQLAAEVFGTSFNIMCYDDESTVETTLVSGSLKVRAGQLEAMLTPGMQAQYDREDKSLEVNPVYAEGYGAWAKQMFVFFDEPIESICRKLSRWYDIEIDASSKRLRGVRYSGMIRRAETLNGIVELLSSTDELRFREVDGRMIVDRK